MIHYGDFQLLVQTLGEKGLWKSNPKWREVIMSHMTGSKEQESMVIILYMWEARPLLKNRERSESDQKHILDKGTTEKMDRGRAQYVMKNHDNQHEVKRNYSEWVMHLFYLFILFYGWKDNITFMEEEFYFIQSMFTIQKVQLKNILCLSVYRGPIWMNCIYKQIRCPLGVSKSSLRKSHVVDLRLIISWWWDVSSTEHIF